MKKFVEKIKKQGLKVKKQRGLDIWEIHDVTTLDAILFGNQTFGDDKWRVSLWQDKNTSVHFLFDDKKDVFDFINILIKNKEN